MKPTLGIKFLAAVIRAGDMGAFIKLGKLDHLLAGHEQPLHNLIQSHVAQFGVLPQLETVKAHLHLEVPAVEEPAAYYLEHLRNRYIEKALRDAVEDAGKHVGEENKNPREALSILTTALSGLMLEDNRSRVFDYRDAYTPVLAKRAEKILTDGISGCPMGWPTLDHQMGGAEAGDVISLIARPGKGKTWLMAYMAYYLWKTQGKVPMFVSMEMKAILIFQRLVAIDAGIPSMMVKTGEMTTAQVDKMKATLLAAKEVKLPFYIVESGPGASEVADLQVLARQLKPAAVFIDGAYLLRHPDKSLTKFRRIDEIAEQLKNLSDNLDVPTFASWQFSRAASRKKKDEPVGLEDIAYSDVIGQISTLVLGAFEDETPETIRTKLLQILKGRGGEVGEFRIKWDFERMDFSEAKSATDDEMKYLD